MDAQTLATTSLRLKPVELAQLHAEMDAAASAGGAKRKRTHQRWPYRSKVAQLEVKHPGGHAATFKVACRDLSAGGMSVLHSAYVHVGTEATVTLTMLTGALVPTPGKVMRCRHVRGNVHEVGLKFAANVEVREFVDIDPFRGGFTLEHVDAARLLGNVLYIGENADLRASLRAALGTTGMNVSTSEAASAGLLRVGEGFDLVFCEFELEGMNGSELCRQARAGGYSGPFVLLSSSNDPEQRAHARDGGASALLVRPFPPEMLLRAAAEFMSADRSAEGAAGPLYTQLDGADPSMAFVADFVEEAHGAAKAIAEAVKGENVRGAQKACLQLKGSAAAMGFPPVRAAAEVALAALANGKLTAEAAEALKRVQGACERVQARPTAAAA
jgi:two-component system chemotaxis response regulator CheY